MFLTRCSARPHVAADNGGKVKLGSASRGRLLFIRLVRGCKRPIGVGSGGSYGVVSVYISASVYVAPPSCPSISFSSGSQRFLQTTLTPTPTRAASFYAPLFQSKIISWQTQTSCSESWERSHVASVVSYTVAASSI